MEPTSAEVWNKLLTIANTGLIALVGFLFREAWITIHKRMDLVEQQQDRMREEYAGRFATLEERTGWTHPHRRTGDSGPFHRPQEG